MPNALGSIEVDAGWECLRADVFERAWRGSIRKAERLCAKTRLSGEALPRSQQHRIDGQQDLIRKPMLEKRRCQRGATREDRVRRTKAGTSEQQGK